MSEEMIPYVISTNECWEMSAVIDGEWHTINIKNEEIFDAILAQRNKNKEKGELEDEQ